MLWCTADAEYGLPVYNGRHIVSSVGIGRSATLAIRPMGDINDPEKIDIGRPNVRHCLSSVET